MAVVKLVKGGSYHGEVKATRDKPIVECEGSVAKRLVATGFFILVDIDSELASVDMDLGVVSRSVGAEIKEKSIGKMTTAELEALAAELGVDISECKNNEERKELLVSEKNVVADSDELFQPLV